MRGKSLWGEIPGSAEGGRNPKQILAEQAETLTDETNSALRGKVVTSIEGDVISHDLLVVAPDLNGYEVALVQARHSALTYPVRITDYISYSVSGFECNDDAEFERQLEKILTSVPVKKIITSLLSQSSPRPPRPVPPPRR